MEQLPPVLLLLTRQQCRVMEQLPPILLLLTQQPLRRFGKGGVVISQGRNRSR
jgi:hypothetical protein